MYGRNGPDQLSLVILIVYLVFYLVAQIFSLAYFGNCVVGSAGLVLFRMLSRNVTALGRK